LCFKAYPHKLGNSTRPRWEQLLRGILKRVVTTRPAIYEAIYFALLNPSDPNS